MKHQDITGFGAIHPFAFVGSADPSLDPDNDVAPNKAWVDTTSGFTLKIRNATDDGWDTISGSGGGSGAGALLYDDVAPATGVVTMNDADIAVWRVSLNANVTSILLASAAAGAVLRVVILFVQDGAGGRTVTGWPVGVEWSGGAAPAIDPTADTTTAVELLIFGDSAIYGVG